MSTVSPFMVQGRTFLSRDGIGCRGQGLNIGLPYLETVVVVSMSDEREGVLKLRISFSSHLGLVIEVPVSFF